MRLQRGWLEEDGNNYTRGRDNDNDTRRQSHVPGKMKNAIALGLPTCSCRASLRQSLWGKTETIALGLWFAKKRRQSLWGSPPAAAERVPFKQSQTCSAYLAKPSDAPGLCPKKSRTERRCSSSSSSSRTRSEGGMSESNGKICMRDNIPTAP